MGSKVSESLLSVSISVSKWFTHCHRPDSRICVPAFLRLRLPTSPLLLTRDLKDRAAAEGIDPAYAPPVVWLTEYMAPKVFCLMGEREVKGPPGTLTSHSPPLPPGPPVFRRSPRSLPVPFRCVSPPPPSSIAQFAVWFLPQTPSMVRRSRPPPVRCPTLPRRSPPSNPHDPNPDPHLTGQDDILFDGECLFFGASQKSTDLKYDHRG